MTAKLDYRWHLRQVMAGHDMFSTTDLIRPLAERGIELSSSQVYRLVVDRPERLSLKILMALLDILDCQMEELIEPVVASVRPRQQKAVGGDAGVEEGAGVGGLRRSEPASPVSDGDDGGVDPAIEGPIGLIVSLIAAIEPGLRVEQIREAVIGVAGGRAKSRQLAAALRPRPAVLLDGLSPALAVVDLLIALRRAGAVSVSWPRCTKCGKELRTDHGAAWTGTARSADRGSSRASPVATCGVWRLGTVPASRDSRDARMATAVTGSR